MLVDILFGEFRDFSLYSIVVFGRYHQTIKQDVKQLPYEVPTDLEAAIAAFVRLLQLPALSHGAGQRDTRGRTQREAGRHPTAERAGILQRRREVQFQTIERRRRYNRTLRELATASS